MTEPLATLVDLDRLGAWMDEQGLPGGPISGATTLPGGTQNILVQFERGGTSFVLRRPPAHKRSGSDEAMRREARVLKALAATNVPHPRLLAACDDEAVIGAAFFLMERVDGANPTVVLPPRYVDRPSWRRQLGLALADGAAAIAAVDHAAVGLDGFGNPLHFLERQVPRWRHQLESYSEMEGYGSPDLPGIATIGTWLDANRPTASTPGLMHGDYHLANVLCSVSEPALVAIVDWELATIGDPLIDLGWLLATWPSELRAPVPSLLVQPWDGFPARADLIARYAERSTRDLTALAWYEVLACYKLGIILEGTYARACAGLAPQDVGQRLHASTLELLSRATTRIAST